MADDDDDDDGFVAVERTDAKDVAMVHELARVLREEYRVDMYGMSRAELRRFLKAHFKKRGWAATTRAWLLQTCATTALRLLFPLLWYRVSLVLWSGAAARFAFF